MARSPRYVTALSARRQMAIDKLNTGVDLVSIRADATTALKQVDALCDLLVSRGILTQAQVDVALASALEQV